MYQLCATNVNTMIKQIYQSVLNAIIPFTMLSSMPIAWLNLMAPAMPPRFGNFGCPRWFTRIHKKTLRIECEAMKFNLSRVYIRFI